MVSSHLTLMEPHKGCGLNRPISTSDLVPLPNPAVQNRLEVQRPSLASVPVPYLYGVFRMASVVNRLKCQSCSQRLLQVIQDMYFGTGTSVRLLVIVISLLAPELWNISSHAPTSPHPQRELNARDTPWTHAPIDPRHSIEVLSYQPTLLHVCLRE